MTLEPIRVLIADDHEIICEALTLCLEREHDIVVIGTAKDGRETLRRTFEETPDVILLDLRLPELDGLQVLSALQSSSSRPAILIMTAHPDEQDMYEALTLGAAGFLTKDIGLRLIPDVIRTALTGKSVVVSSTFPDRIERWSHTDAGQRLHRGEAVELTDEQLRILALLAKGLTNDEIGSRLSISVRAVKTRLSALYRKIGVRHRTEAVIWAEEQGFVPES